MMERGRKEGNGQGGGGTDSGGKEEGTRQVMEGGKKETDEVVERQVEDGVGGGILGEGKEHQL